MAKKKVWRKNLSKRETWKNGHSYQVTRDSRGRWVTSHRIRQYKYQKARRGWRVTGFKRIGRKHVAVYGRTMSNKTGKVKHNRIEISGQGKEIYEALGMMFGSGYVPRKPYQKVDADDLNEEPYEYLEGGDWIEREVES